MIYPRALTDFAVDTVRAARRAVSLIRYAHARRRATQEPR